MEINIWHLIFSSFFTIITALIIKKVQNGLEEKEKLKKGFKATERETQYNNNVQIKFAY